MIPLSSYDRETLEQLGKFGAGLLEDRVRALMVDRNKVRAENARLREQLAAVTR